MTTTIRTRFAPSPTGYLHIGGARTALFAWAYARRHGGRFVLRIEDTDLERSTQVSVQAILDGLRWLGIEWDEGPHFQMQRLPRYREVAERLIETGHAYRCYASRAELDELRERQRATGEKPRYDGRWRPERARGRTPPPGVDPVIRFRNPDGGHASWNDLVKGPIRFENAELDDLVLLRADGVPTYNFGVVVDDLDMQITHVIRGDDHVNNTPRQINIFRALGASLPHFGHVPMILGSDGERLSKRHGAVSVIQYRDDGYLPEAMVNYLARLGWSHGDDEVFGVEQFIDWFDLGHISRSAAQFNPEKLAWINGEYIRRADDARLGRELAARLQAKGITVTGADPAAVAALFKERVATLEELADAAHLVYAPPHPSAELLAQHLSGEVRPALRDLAARLAAVEWRREPIGAAIREVLAAHRFKLPQLAMPLRVLTVGTTRTPSIDALLALLPREHVVDRLDRHLG
jgi:glutamyl-tRNA synthetase